MSGVPVISITVSVSDGERTFVHVARAESVLPARAGDSAEDALALADCIAAAIGSLGSAAIETAEGQARELGPLFEYDEA